MPFILDIGMLRILSNAMSKELTCETNRWMQVFEMNWFLDTGENEAACVEGQQERYKLLLVMGCHQLPLSCTSWRGSREVKATAVASEI